MDKLGRFLDFGGATQTKWTIFISLILIGLMAFQLFKEGKVQPEIAGLVKDTLMVMWGALGVRNTVRERSKTNGKSSSSFESDLVG